MIRFRIIYAVSIIKQITVLNGIPKSNFNQNKLKYLLIQKKKTYRRNSWTPQKTIEVSNESWPSQEIKSKKNVFYFENRSIKP